MKKMIPQNNILLSCKNLNLTIGNRAILKNTGFTIYSGDRILLTGENGAGKTSLLKKIYTDSRKPRDFSWVCSIHSVTGTVFCGHETGLYSSLTLRENLEYYKVLYGISEETDGLWELFQKFRLYQWLDEPINSFSEGMKKKSALSLALCSNSSLLLLDEPWNSLDADSSQHLYEKIYSLGNEKTVIAVSHENGYLKGAFKRRFLIENKKLSEV